MFIVNVNLHLVNKRNEGSINVTCTNAAKKKRKEKGDGASLGSFHQEGEHRPDLPNS